MKRSTLYIILLFIGLLAVWSYFRIQSQDQQEQTQETLLKNLSESVELQTKMAERQMIGQERLNLTINKIDNALGNISVIVTEQERQRQEANITTKSFVDDFNKLFDIIEEQERQRQEANITTSGFVEDFKVLENEVHETLDILNRSVTNEGVLQTTVSRLQLDAAQSVENERTMFQYLDDLRAKIENLTLAIQQNKTS